VRRLTDGKEIHTGVWARRLGAKLVPAAVFCEMVEGTYQIIGIQTQEVEVRGGQVTDFDTRVA
jgi:hypothetical protein